MRTNKPTGASMPNQEKYLNTMNLGRNDENKLGWEVGAVLHTSGTVTANGYNYCGYEETRLPRETLVRIIGIKQTTLNASYDKNGIGDVYVDFECVDLKNSDGTPIMCGNRHAWSLLEANPDHMVCPDGSGDLGMVMDGVWKSYAGEYGEPNEFGQKLYLREKTIILEKVA
jgi:hypothetical protein